MNLMSRKISDVLKGLLQTEVFCFMDDFIDTEPYLLLTGAKNDINSIRSELKDKESSKEDKAYNICFHASRAAEKMIKAYIIYSDANIKVRPTHNFDYLEKILYAVNDKFKILKDDFSKFDLYKSWTGYEPKIPIEHDELMDTLKALKNIYNFKPIKEMRYILNKKYKFNVHHDRITDTLINIAENNDILICYKSKKIDTKNQSALEKMNLRKVPFALHKNIIKYIQEKDKIERYILARNMENNIVELFFIDRDFNEKQADLFLKG
jgi:HEPN domain-containing protein